MSFNISLDFGGPSRLFHTGVTWLSGALYISSGTITHLFRSGKYQNVVFQKGKALDIFNGKQYTYSQQLVFIPIKWIICLLNVSGFNTSLLILQLHVKDLNKTIWYMYRHKKYRKVNKHIRSCEIKRAAGMENRDLSSF